MAQHFATNMLDLGKKVYTEKPKVQRNLHSVMVAAEKAGHLPAAHETAENRVMVIERGNYTGCMMRGALAFQCSLCSYVGDRYYHAGESAT